MSFRPALRIASTTLKHAKPTAALTRFALARTPARAPTLASFNRRSYATSMSDTSSSFDPQSQQAQARLDAGTRALEQGDLESAAKEYKESLKIKDSAIGHYNLGVVQYQQQNLPEAIASFEASLALTPKPKGSQDPNEPIPVMTPERVVLGDTYTNLGAAYILSQPPRADKALENMQKALEINPDDGEVCYNLAAVLEATGEIEEALIAFQRAEKLGIERAKTNIRNVGAKLLAKRREEEANPKPEPKA